MSRLSRPSGAARDGLFVLVETQGTSRSLILIAIVAFVILAVILNDALEKRHEADAVAPTSTQAASPTSAAKPAAPEPPKVDSPYPECRSLEAAFRRMQQKLGCTWDGWAIGHAICKIVYNEKKDCADEFEAMARCIRAQPESSWQCDAQARVALKEKFCTAEISALRACTGG